MPRPAPATRRDTSIETYRAKRNFTITGEPAPRYPQPGPDAPMFVVQKHAAHRAGLHWDFRLEHGGVLWSWAVRKGPSLDPHDKRISAHVEDHPIDYADFQGTIPDGQYGAGTVETWDRGTWQPLNDPEAGLRDGEIKFVLAGQRLHGKFTLVRLKPRPNERRRQDNWLLIKGHDEAERVGADAATLEAEIPPPGAPAKAKAATRRAAEPDAEDDPKPGGKASTNARAARKGRAATDATAVPDAHSAEDAGPGENARSAGSARAAGKSAAAPSAAPKSGGAATSEAARSSAAGSRPGPSKAALSKVGSSQTGPSRTGPSRTSKAAEPTEAEEPPAEGASRGKLPERQAPQLALLVDTPPEGDDWLTEIKFDGYRLLIFVEDGKARIVTRNGHDWTDRLPAVARAAAALDVQSALLDGELVALDKEGLSSFPLLQAALSAGRDQTLTFYAFDLLHLDGWDLRPCPLTERKRVLASLDLGHGMFRYSDHHQGEASAMRRQACQMKLEGVICKQADAPYRAGRGHGWVKVKCQGREELVVLGWTPPAGSRTGFGALHLGYYDEQGGLNYAGGVGSGFSDDELETLSKRLADLAADPPGGLLVAGDPLDPAIHWVKPELVAEVQFIAWSGAGRVRHGVYLGLREDKGASEVVRPVANPEAERHALTPKPPRDGGRQRGPVIAVPPRRPPARAAIARATPAPATAPPAATARATPTRAAAPPAAAAPRAAAARVPSGAIVTAKAPKSRSTVIEGVTLSHPDRELWPGITKQQLAEYWVAVAGHALPGLAHRPLAIVRCPEGIDGEHFFQKHGRGMLPDGVREGEVEKAPFLAIDDLHGLVAMAQISAIELHAWGATEADPLHPDQIVFDLDPGEGVAFPQVVAAAQDVRRRLEALGLAAFCRTTGGKGLHVVAPLQPEAHWDTVKPFCRAFAEAMAKEAPDRYLSTVKIADRRGRILVDWLRNGMGATAVASFCPRTRPGAGVATPLAWDEVTQKLDPAAFTLGSVPARLARLHDDPWGDFEIARRKLPDLTKTPSPKGDLALKPAGKARIVKASPPRKR